ncbi:hypothetical protein [Nocardia puris]|uniref:Uncharacterized protein n=1 Tax=Nocardia puris TaxID=208602 RepID=A0A366CW47_9NOCA|nr:hypothetical protein [Nocardia puris]RBO82062.1 hypothetical protein DFR74_12517 [Nocardia puris]
MSTRFDPRYHTAAEVLAYLATADPREVGRVLAAERTGRGRAAILSRFREQRGGRHLEVNDG